ncbi:MAG TPA: phosphodiester glycosidase family protein [Longilinea sp.]|nr:phosphodiester glycosidase family protein [Longilinea sp.]
MFRKKKLIRTIMIVVIFLGTLSYLLADRYLIQHVEIANVNAAALTEAASAETTAIVEQTEAAAVTETVVADDWNYQSSDLSITVTQVTTGSGNDTVTYFVADVVLSDATQLESAFADNSFGRNIIEYTSVIAEENNALFAINGDYYGFREDGIEIRNGVIYQDIPARIGLAFYRDGSMEIYDETQTTAEQLLADGVWNTLSFGPALLENSQIVSNLGTVEIDTNFGNHSIQGSNPRTGIGIIDENHFVFIVVDGRSAGYSRGVTLDEFAQIFQNLGCTEAYNIDGGGSSTMYFMGRVVNNPLGRNHERGTSDILFITE